MSGFPFGDNGKPVKSGILDATERERNRQRAALIMIPSESICHPRAAELLSSELGNIYAEGQPQPILLHDPRESAADAQRFHSWQTRLADRRYYKGTVEVNRVELLAQQAIADVFSCLAGSPASEKIHVNVQALSGAPANMAVYEALLEHGDRVMGLDLSHGGHLTHGSEFNFSGKTYLVNSYGIDPVTRKLDYARIREQAIEFKPKLIIGGASSYPWDFDWKTLREIADATGAFLLADVAHLAGLIAGGVLNNPLPYAHVCTFTTHKTLCGPRGAVIMSAEPEIGRMLDSAVFPGLQGGPHMNTIAAIGRLFELIGGDYEAFCAFQRKVVANAAFFAQALQNAGFALEYHGTNTHMVLVDLKQLRVAGDAPIDGEIASRLLEIAGIVVNKNVLPGDPSGAQASGIRFGLPWLTQRGINDEQLTEIAAIAHDILSQVHTFKVWSPMGEEKCRGRIPEGMLEAAAARIANISAALPYPGPAAPEPSLKPPQVADRVALLLRGDKVRLMLSQVLTARVPVDRSLFRAQMLRDDGAAIDDVTVIQLESQTREERWLLLPHAAKAQIVARWLRNLSDGYVLFDAKDLHRKIDGPTVVEAAPIELLPTDLVEQISRLPIAEADLKKPYFIGQNAIRSRLTVQSQPLSRYIYKPKEIPLRNTVLNSLHHALGAKMVPFAGWEMPVQYPSGILAEHRAVRTAAGLFDVSHMNALEFSGPHALPFLETLLANTVTRLNPGEAQYNYMLYPDGTAVDDLYVYRLAAERFMLVVNASNAERVKDWVQAVMSRSVIIDLNNPAKQADGPVQFRDLRNAGDDSLVSLALQGPVSTQILQKLAGNPTDALAIGRLNANEFASVALIGKYALVARTGYTGEKIGYEIYVHPDNLPALWNAALEAGKPLGAIPAGLGARDSTRIEAGFPLFGHELEGDLGVSLTEAGYGFVVRFHTPFFIGRDAYRDRVRKSPRKVIRLRGNGRKSLRGGHVILDDSGAIVGTVTSFAYAHEDMTFFVLACVDKGFSPEPGETVRGSRVTKDKAESAADPRNEVELTAVTRFADEEEKCGWPERYANTASLTV